jgi:hypothetical protein
LYRTWTEAMLTLRRRTNSVFPCGFIPESGPGKTPLLVCLPSTGQIGR